MVVVLFVYQINCVAFASEILKIPQLVKSSKLKSPAKWNTPNEFFKTYQQSCLTTLNRSSANQFKTVPNYPQTSNLVQLVLATKDDFESDFKRPKMNLIISSESPSESETECELELKIKICKQKRSSTKSPDQWEPKSLTMTIKQSSLLFANLM